MKLFGRMLIDLLVYFLNRHATVCINFTRRKSLGDLHLLWNSHLRLVRWEVWHTYLISPCLLTLGLVLINICLTNELLEEIVRRAHIDIFEFRVQMTAYRLLSTLKGSLVELHIYSQTLISVSLVRPLVWLLLLFVWFKSFLTENLTLAGNLLKGIIRKRANIWRLVTCYFSHSLNCLT